MICPHCDSEVAHRPGCLYWPESIHWVPDASDGHVAEVFRWLDKRGIRYELKNNARDLLLNGGVFVFDGQWIVYENGVVYAEDVVAGEATE